MYALIKLNIIAEAAIIYALLSPHLAPKVHIAIQLGHLAC